MCENTYINIQNGEILDMEHVASLPENSLLKMKPELWRELDFNKNTGINIYNITFGSKKDIWWICLKCKSSYNSKAQYRYSGRKCPYCAGKRVNSSNSLASKYPELINQWDFIKNKDITPDQVSYGSEKVYWWYCKECDISYESVVRNKVFAQGCPYCSSHRTSDKNSLATLNPKLASEWHNEKNGDLTPNDVTPNSHKQAWWICDKGHEWKTVIKSRHRGSSCPYCTNRKVFKGYNDIWTTNSGLAMKLENASDGYIYSQYSQKRVNWTCPNCKRIIKMKKISDVNIYGLSCQNCTDGISIPEKVMREILLQLNIEFKNDIPFSWSNNKRYDFFLPSHNVIIEMHGRQHSDGGFATLGGKSLEEETANDEIKYNLAINNGINRYIIIDSKESDILYLKNSILSSELVKLFDLDDVDWITVNTKAQKSVSYECLLLWKNGVRDITNIATELSIHKEMVRRYLKQWSNLGLCDFNDFDNRKNKILQLTIDGELIREWDSVNEIVDKYFKNQSKRILIERVLTGLDDHLEGFKWEYKEGKKKKSGNRRQVVKLDYDLNYLNHYNSIIDAALANNIMSYNHIVSCCKNKRPVCGGYRWMYKEDYEKQYGKIDE